VIGKTTEQFFGSVTELSWYEDGRGKLMEILRGEGVDFGQAYVTTCRPGVVKAWHHHERQTDRMICLHGALQIGLVDLRAEKTTTVYSSPHAPRLVTIRPGIWHGFSAVGAEEAIVLNIPDRAYDRKNPDEQRRLAHDPAIPYHWGVQDG
jgi:dTDP-4-dehydrorhamnose 3,5-epimerase